MITRGEAIKRIDEQYKICEEFYYLSASPEKDCPGVMSYMEALVVAISALRPVSREQVEEVYPACDVCGGGKEIRSDNFCGMARLRIVGDSINLRGDEKKIKFFGHIYAPSFSVRFCPFCGKPLTDKAMQMVMERLEALKDGKGD